MGLAAADAVGGAAEAVGGADCSDPAVGGASALALGGLAVGGALLAAASACLAAAASAAAGGGGAAASVPARSASALSWAWVPAALTCWVAVACAVASGWAGRAGKEARSGVVVLASWAACCGLSGGNWVVEAEALSSPPIKPVGSRSDNVWQPAVPAASVSASVAITIGRA